MFFGKFIWILKKISVNYKMLNKLNNNLLSKVFKNLSPGDLARLRAASKNSKTKVNANKAKNRLNQETNKMKLKQKRKTQINYLIRNQRNLLPQYSKTFTTILGLPYKNNFYNQFVNMSNNYMTRLMNARNLVLAYQQHIKK